MSTEKEKTHYSDEELAEFKELIAKKLESAKAELSYLQEQISNAGDNGTNDTINKFNGIEDGVDSMERKT